MNAPLGRLLGVALVAQLIGGCARSDFRPEDYVLAGDWAIAVTTSLPAGMVGVPYTHQLAATGGSGHHTWSLTTPVTGFSLSPEGVLSGTPTGAGTVLFAVEVTDSEIPESSGRAVLPMVVSGGSGITILQASPVGSSIYFDVVLRFDALPAEGSTVVVGLTTTDPSVHASAISDDQGGTYELAKASARAIFADSENYITDSHIFFRANIPAPAAAYTITIANSEFGTAQALEVAGLDAATPEDVATAATGTTGASSVTVVAASALSQANELAVSVMGISHATSPESYAIWTSSPSWVVDGTMSLLTSDAAAHFGFAHQVTSSTTAPAITWDYRSNVYDQGEALLVTFKGS